MTSPTLTSTTIRWWVWQAIMWLMIGGTSRRGPASCRGSGGGRQPQGSCPILRPVKKTKTIYKWKPKTINVDKNVSEAVAKRIKGLTSLFLGMGAFKPAGILTDSLKAEWKQTCTRIAEKKVQDSEKATLDRVVNTCMD